MGMSIPHFGLARQYKEIGEELLDATHRAMKDGILVGGHYTRSFEEWLKHKTRAKYAVTVHSGTQALEIIARYKKIKHHEIFQETSPDRPIIRIPNLTYPATLNAFLSTGWDVQLADTDKNGIIRHDSRVGGIYDCVMGYAGRRPWDDVRYEDSHGVIVDGAQHWLVADGNVGSGMAISFDPTKNLNSSGNGGAIVTNDEKLYLYASSHRDNCKPYFHEAGTNSKMSEIDCAHLLVRIKYLDAWQLRRAKISEYWCTHFSKLPLSCLNDTRFPHANQKFVMYLDERNSLHTHMMLNGVDTKRHYDYVLGDLPTGMNLKKPDMLSTSVMLSRGVLSLPLYPELTDIEVDYIADMVHDFYK
jgi:dTDP-4-amino-4,6-dideoxygalactose transaminase